MTREFGFSRAIRLFAWLFLSVGVCLAHGNPCGEAIEHGYGDSEIPVSPLKRAAAQLVSSRLLQATGPKFNLGETRAVSREGIRFLVDHREFNVREKVLFWTDFAVLLNMNSRERFISNQFRGSDGSYLFQGDHEGIALVISPNGSIWRGSLSPPLPTRFPRPIWPADYSQFRELR